MRSQAMPILKTGSLMIVTLIAACGGSDGGGGGGGGDDKPKVVVNAEAASYVEDGDQNDNLTLLETSCDLDDSSGRRVMQYFSSEALGSGKIVGMDYYVPALSEWVDGKVTVADDAESCNAPGYRSLVTGDLAAAKADADQEFLYGCGATCVYTLIAETHDADGKYKTAELSWECTDVAANGLVGSGIFGAAVDRHVGKLTCR